MKENPDEIETALAKFKPLEDTKLYETTTEVIATLLEHTSPEQVLNLENQLKATDPDRLAR